MKRLFLMLSAMLLAISVNANAGFEDVTITEQLALVHFNTDSSMLDSAAKIALGKLKVSSNSEVIVIGKTDNRASAEYNVALGLRRAESVKNFIGSNGHTFSVSSVGETDAVETNRANMRSDRVALVKVITPYMVLNPLFGDAMLNLQGPVSHIEYNTIPVGQGAKRVTQPRW